VIRVLSARWDRLDGTPSSPGVPWWAPRRRCAPLAYHPSKVGEHPRCKCSAACISNERRWLRRRPMQGGTSCWTYSGALSRSGQTRRCSRPTRRRTVRFPMACLRASTFVISSAAGPSTRAMPFAPAAATMASLCTASLCDTQRLPVWHLPSSQSYVLHHIAHCATRIACCSGVMLMLGRCCKRRGIVTGE